MSSAAAVKTRHHFPRKWIFFGVFLLLVLASNIVRHYWPVTPPARDGQQFLQVREFDIAKTSGKAVPTGREIKIAYEDFSPANKTDAPPVLLLHGTPGSSSKLVPLAKLLSENFRVILPDLPGAGRSQRHVVDYSVEANANAVSDLLKKLNIPKAHVIGFGQGGAVAIDLAKNAPAEVASLSLLSSVGAQEFELLGNHFVNKIVYTFHLFFVKVAEDVIPHFGLMDLTPINTSYARGFWDSDFSDMKYHISGYTGPLFIAHGESDPFVSADTAKFSAQLAPQAKTLFVPGGHGVFVNHPEKIAGELTAFIDDAVAGKAPVRTTPVLARSELPDAPPAEGLRLWMLFLIIIVCAFVAEDPTCLATGLLAATKVISFTNASIACLVSIFIGDFFLYLIGYVLGRPAFRKAPLKWLIAEYEIDRMAGWFEKKGFQGLLLIVTSRFIPGSRVPTFVGAGVMRLSMWKLALLFFIAAASWTPILIFGTKYLYEKVYEGNSDHVIGFMEHLKHNAMWVAIALLLGVWLVFHVLVPALTWGGRRQLVMKMRRWTRHEFWPTLLLYGGVITFWFWESLRRLSFTRLSVANPGLGRQSGFTGESKNTMFGAFPAATPIAPWCLLPGEKTPTAERVALAKKFMTERSLAYPMVLKPDLGDDGMSVNIVRNDEQLAEWLGLFKDDAVLQQYTAGEEYEVVWSRLPGETRGQIMAVTEKRIVKVVGDGERALENLIWADDRAVSTGKHYLRLNWRRASDVIPAGEVVELAHVGTHRAGAQIVDRPELCTEKLARALDPLADGVPEGLHFAIYDLRVAEPAMLAAGKFTITGIAGAGSVSSHFHDQFVRLGHALSAARKQMRRAFAAADILRAAGKRPVGAIEMLAAWAEARGRVIIDLRK